LEEEGKEKRMISNYIEMLHICVGKEHIVLKVTIQLGRVRKGVREIKRGGLIDQINAYSQLRYIEKPFEN
jgi:hypothetical protein